MKYLAIPFLAIAMMFGGMSDAYAGHKHKHHKMWVVKETKHGLKWYKFDKHKHMKKYGHHHKKWHHNHWHHKHCMHDMCMKHSCSSHKCMK